MTIPGGSLMITTPYSADSPFDLGTAMLDPAQPSSPRLHRSATRQIGPAKDNAGVTITDTDGW